MKTTRKFMAILMVLAMILSMGAFSAFAATITINDGDVVSGASYSAYKLLDATDGGNNMFAYTVNTNYESALKAVLGADATVDAATIKAYIDKHTAQGFADAVYAQVKAMAPDATATNNVFSNVKQGYYLIVETEVGTTTAGNGSDVISLVMLDTAGNESITVQTKENIPTVDKEIVDGENKEYADKAIGDVVNYKITGTVADKYADYQSYYYSFEDNMSVGLTLNKESIVIMIGDTDVTDQFTIVSTAQSFTATANLKELTGVTINSLSNVVITYSATLNENAVSGTNGNTNEVLLKYENNPYNKADGNPETPDKPENPGETPKDIVVVFTFDAVVEKVDQDKNPLAGAGFTLYKKNATDGWDQVGNEITGANMTTFNFNGIDVGEYKLVESTVPAGYNKAADIEFSISATYDTSTEKTTLTSLNVTPADKFDVKLEAAEGSVTTTVENNKGAELPSTGGMGTVLLIGAGSVLAVAAALFLVTKKRVKNAEF